jgi:hypothetical protein
MEGPNALPGDTGTIGAPVAHHPRDDEGPKDWLDLLDRHLSRATESEVALKRYRLLLRDSFLVGLTLFAASGLLVHSAELGRLVSGSPWHAAGLGVGVTGAAALRLAYRRRRRRQGAVREAG